MVSGCLEPRCVCVLVEAEPWDSWGRAIKDTSTPFSEVLYSSPGGVARVFKASVRWDCSTFTEHLKYSASLIASIISVSGQFPQRCLWSARLTADLQRPLPWRLVWAQNPKISPRPYCPISSSIGHFPNLFPLYFPPVARLCPSIHAPHAAESGRWVMSLVRCTGLDYDVSESHTVGFETKNICRLST